MGCGNVHAAREVSAGKRCGAVPTAHSFVIAEGER
jgi:hypothetical protein